VIQIAKKPSNTENAKFLVAELAAAAATERHLVVNSL